MSLRIGIDISSIPYNRGVSRYTANLLRCLWKLRTKENLEIKPFGVSVRQLNVLRRYVQEESPMVSATLLPIPVRTHDLLWNTLHLGSPELITGELDVFHSWEVQPPLAHAALVSTIHDLGMLRYPQTADPYVLSMNKKSWKHLKKEAKAIVAISQATKNDIVELLQIEPERISVIPEALTAEAKILPSIQEQKRILQELNLQRPYIFFIGTTEPRKNLNRLIQAWEPLKKEYDLVIAGASGWDTLKRARGIHLLGYVTNDQLAVLYSGASVLAYPSLYEGFGLPILDAFFHKVPVVTSNVSSMPEVAGDAAVLVDPCSAESITKGLETAIQHKAVLIKKGTAQLKKFDSWDEVAIQTLKVYRKAKDLCA